VHQTVTKMTTVSHPPAALCAYHIYLVGTGITGLRQITPEAVAALRTSHVVFYLDQSIGMGEYLNQLCPNVINLSSYYKEGLDRGETYRRISATVFSAALEDPPVALALYGHPLVFALPPFQLMALARVFDLRAKVIPGLSSLDTMFVDLNLDPAVDGLQIYEATDVVVRQRPLQPDVPCFLLQVGSFGTSIFSLQSNAPSRFAVLRDYLLRFYPPEHEVSGVTSAGHPLVSPTISKFKLKFLEQHAAQLDYGVTLYIPPAFTRPLAGFAPFSTMVD
jgi:uncharacterized protein YabN with tetrapyrrole methylase and pyrophosphatase domain